MALPTSFLFQWCLLGVRILTRMAKVTTGACLGVSLSSLVTSLLLAFSIPYFLATVLSPMLSYFYRLMRTLGLS